VISPSKLGENWGRLFDKCSARNRATMSWRPPPDPANGSPGAVGAATGAEVRSVLERTSIIYRKPVTAVEYVAQSFGCTSYPRCPSLRGRR
jgi:hypothetical protein